MLRKFAVVLVLVGFVATLAGCSNPESPKPKPGKTSNTTDSK